MSENHQGSGVDNSSVSERISDSMKRVDCSVAFRALTKQELDVCLNCVKSSIHSKIQPMPTHGISPEGQLEGFVFECSPVDSASILPVSLSCFAATCIYEVNTASIASTPYLDLVNNIDDMNDKLMSLVEDMKNDECSPLTLNCMADYENIKQQGQGMVQDECEWREELPAKLGIYHCFMRTNAQNQREHKVFIVISGNCQHATEEIHKLWLDAAETMTAGEFIQCPEVEWLRQTTLRHHNRLAHRVATSMNMSVQSIDDMECVGSQKKMLLPTLSCFYRDMALINNKVYLSTDACLLALNCSGVVFDCFSDEGFWVFTGPQDYSSYKIFGSNFQTNRQQHVFPTKSVFFHSLYPSPQRTNVISIQQEKQPITQHTRLMHITTHHSTKRRFNGYLFPHAEFLQHTQKLGFSLNDGIANLMPILVYCTDE